MANLKLIVLLVFVSYNILAANGDAAPKISTDLGDIEGTVLTSHDGKEVAAFLGIPYAHPPTEALRFQPPKPLTEKFASTIEAKHLPSSCVQVTKTADAGGHDAQSEDCLYLNIYAPKPKPTNASVLVFVHGGNFVSGSSNTDNYDGRELVAHENVIVVTLNYRLGVFGFLYVGSEDAPGNVGLMDIRQALKFVKKNIAHFGGNPHKVTLMGEGAGATSAGLLMLSHSCSCLFQRVVLLNGSPLDFSVTPKTEALEIVDELADATGCPRLNNVGGSHETVNCIKGKSAQILTNSTITLLREIKRFLPVVDGKFLSKAPVVLAKQGSFDPDIRVLLGASHNRASVANFFLSPLKPKEDSYITTGDFKNLIHRLMRDDSEYATSSILVHYQNLSDPDDPESIRENSLHLTTDIGVICPIVSFADELAYSGNKVSMFYINHHVNSSYPSFAGNMYGEDLNFFFGHTDGEGYKSLENDRGFTLMSLLGKFVRHEDEVHDNDSEEDGKHLPRYSLRTKTYLDLKIGGKTGHFLSGAKCAFFKDVYYSRIRKISAFMAAHGC